MRKNGNLEGSGRCAWIKDSGMREERGNIGRMDHAEQQSGRKNGSKVVAGI